MITITEFKISDKAKKQKNYIKSIKMNCFLKINCLSFCAVIWHKKTEIYLVLN